MSSPLLSRTPLGSSALYQLLASDAVVEINHAVKRCSHTACIATSATNTLATSCGHVFHHDCLAKHLERSFRCPHCQTNLRASPLRAPGSTDLSDGSNSEEEMILNKQRFTHTKAKRARKSGMKYNTSSRKRIGTRGRQITDATQALHLTTQGLKNASNSLHIIADIMQRTAREMVEISQEAQLEKLRRNNTARRMRERKERMARERMIAKMGIGKMKLGYAN